MKLENSKSNQSEPPLPSALFDLQQRAQQHFLDRFDSPAATVVAAPGRVNLIGEHVDYNDGFVLPMALERYVVIAAAPAAATSSSTNTIRIYSVALGRTETISLDQPIQPIQTGERHWINYVAGVVAAFVSLGKKVPNFDAVIDSNIPLGGGLSSSAALEVATATLLEQLTGTVLEPRDKALLCQQAEHEFAGVPCGIMDQFSSVFGRSNELMLIDCHSQRLEYVPFFSDKISILLTNSNVQHQLSGGEYAARRGECIAALKKLAKESWREVTLEQIEDARGILTKVEFQRSKHVVSEIIRTVQAAKAFRAGDWNAIGRLMYASHRSLSDDFEVSCSEMDTLVEIASTIGKENGMFGSRMTGGGFGGCTVSIVDNEKLELVASTIIKQFKLATGITATCFSSRPGRGSHVIKAL